MLKAQGVTFAYPGRACVLSGVSLEVHPGERVGLAGPSGCGKTTLGRLLAGYLRPQAGIITVANAPLMGRGPCPVQLVPQHPELAVNPRWHLRDVLAETMVGEKLVDDLGIDRGWLGRYPVELSGGELQRVVLARALAVRPRYLVCDEMTAMLDALTQAQIWRVLLRYADMEGMGLVVISHDPELLGAVCQRVVRLG